MASFLNVVNSVRQEVTIENISDDIMYLSSIIEKLASEGKMCKSLSMTAYVTNLHYEIPKYTLSTFQYT